MIFNLWKTVKQGVFLAEEAAEAPAREQVSAKNAYWHRWIETRWGWMTIFSLVAVGIGGMIEIIPMMTMNDQVPRISSVKPYTPLELHGRDIYIREGCVGCHSQMIRPFRDETERYGEYSKSGEFIYDRPFLWGSKRTGPDLHRDGGKYPNSWHYNHMMEPSSMSPGSIMPSYPWLLVNRLDTSQSESKIKTLRFLGTPYPEGFEHDANDSLRAQANVIANNLRESGIKDAKLDKREIVALIAYLQRLGTDIKK